MNSMTQRESWEIAKTIASQISAGRTEDDKPGKLAMMCWAYRQPTVMKIEDRPALAFRVSGAKFRGIVAVILDEGADLYNVRLMYTDMKQPNGYRTKLERTGIYCDQLTAVIDALVETKGLEVVV